ncbi:CoA pyrophosphatase [Panacagrimonas sp.]|uniref:CoA pyrophosphatase n=1 Tax=Panacagrimonas sp. TaxID=2480088 RepID=UPI003B51D3E2
MAHFKPEALEARLRAALAGTHDTEPRPIAKLDLPLGGDRWLTPAFMKALRPAAVLAPVVRGPDGYSILLTRRSDALASHRGQVSFPGGRRDDTDTSAAANALREAHEEVGLDPLKVEILGYLDDYPTISRYRVTPVVGLVDGPVAPVIQVSEVAEAFEVPMHIVLDPKVYVQRSLTREGLMIPFYELDWGPQRIWGATAGMLHDLCLRFHAQG